MRTRDWIPAILFAIATAASLQAQCNSTWTSSPLGFGVSGTASAFGRWDPDGAGPKAEQIVIGGQFSQAGNVLTANLAFLDPTTGAFSAPGAQPNGHVRGILRTSAGDLLIVGSFTSIGSLPARGIARFDGTTWSSIGGGIDGDVYDVAEAPSGDLYFGGSFLSVGSSNQPAGSIARWDNSSWDTLGVGLSGANGIARARRVIVDPSGDLVVAGTFSTAGGLPIPSAARYDGSTWMPLGSGMPPIISVQDILLRANGDYAVAVSAPSASAVVLVSGGVWQSTAAGGPSFPRRLLELQNGTLIAKERGFFAPGGLFQLDAAGWSQLVTSGDGVNAMIELDVSGDLLIGGNMVTVAGTATRGLAARISGTWIGDPTPTLGEVNALACAPDGTQFAGGNFMQLGGSTADWIAQWDGITWQALGAGTNAEVNSIAVVANGDVYVSGYFSMAGGATAFGIARWNGSSWSAVPGAPVYPSGIRAMRDGGLLIASNPIAIVSSSGIATLPTTGTIVDAIELPDGRIAATGSISQWGTSTASRTAIWDGLAWAPTTLDHSAATALGIAPNGDLAVVAPHANGESIRTWNGSSWQSMGTDAPPGAVDLTSLPDGAILVGCDSQPGSTLWRYDGTTWTSIGNTNTSVSSVSFSPDGEILAALRAPESKIARLRTSCPATLASLPSACAIGGATLSAAVRPFVGGSYRGVATELGTSVLAVHAFGSQSSSTQLAALLPTAGAGCLLHVTPELLELDVVANATSTAVLAVPTVPALIGVGLWHQTIGVDLTAGGNLATITASNALAMTVGSF